MATDYKYSRAVGLRYFFSSVAADFALRLGTNIGRRGEQIKNTMNTWRQIIQQRRHANPPAICVSPTGKRAKQTERGRSHNQNTHTKPSWTRNAVFAFRAVCFRLVVWRVVFLLFLLFCCFLVLCFLLAFFSSVAADLALRLGPDSQRSGKIVWKRYETLWLQKTRQIHGENKDNKKPGNSDSKKAHTKSSELSPTR